MNVLTILERKGTHAVHTITGDRTIQEAIRILVEHNVGSLVVVGDGGEVVGIVTERDILGACARGQDLETVRVAAIMTEDLIVGEPGDTIDYVMGIMTHNRIRHLPILERGALSGMVSIGDVVQIQLQQTEYENRHLRSYITGSY